MTIRALKKGDETKLEQFLKQYAETSMFLRSNLRNSGLGYHESPYHGEYIASFDINKNINGVIVHYWNCIIMMQSDSHQVLEALLQSFKTALYRPIAGILGPSDQARRVIEYLNIQEDKLAINRAEGLYRTKISELKPFSLPEKHKIEIVDAKMVNPTILFEWLKDYHIESLGGTDNDALRQQIKIEVSYMMEGMDRWVLLVNSKPSCLVGFNARLPDIVQLGPVWTPVKYRNRGYAKMLISLVLKKAQNTGVEKAFLFTDNPAAIKAYETIGFEKCGSIRLAITK